MNNRFFLEDQFQLTTYQLQGEELRHLRVMRVKIGQFVTLVNGKGEKALAELVQLEKTVAKLKIITIERASTTSYKTVLALAICKQNRLEIALEKVTEIGIDDILFYVGERSEKKQINIARLEKIGISAMKQCGRLHLPKIVSYPTIKDIPTSSFPTYYGDLTGKNSTKTEMGGLFFIGPEKGFSAQELTFLMDRAAKPVSLSPYVLRAETAAIAAAVWLHI